MKFGTPIPVQEPQQVAHPQDKIRAFLQAERHEFWEHHNYSSLWTGEPSKTNPKRQEF